MNNIMNNVGNVLDRKAAQITRSNSFTSILI